MSELPGHSSRVTHADIQYSFACAVITPRAPYHSYRVCVDIPSLDNEG